MLCGLPRFSLRSLTATSTFFAVASLTTNLLHTFPSTTSGVPPITLAPTPSLLPLLATLVTPLLALLSLRHLPKNSRISQTFASTITGLVFGLGLLVSGMASPGKVLSFLSLRIWEFDPSLICVVLFAILPNALLWWRSRSISSALRCPCPPKGYEPIEAPASPTTPTAPVKPVLCEKFELPTKTELDMSLVMGSAVFGLGWGLAGICPGPGVLGMLLNGVAGGLYMLGFGLGRGAGEVWGRVGKAEKK